MSLQTLVYQADFRYEGTRDGIPIYDGSATQFADWSFRTRIKYSAAKDKDKPKIMASIVEGLRGDAAEMAKDIGIEELLKKDTGLQKPEASIKKSIFPKVEAGAKLLYRHGNKKHGVLA